MKKNNLFAQIKINIFISFHALKNKFCLFILFILTFSFIKLYGNVGACIPSVLAIFVDSPMELRCGSSNPKIVEIGNIRTSRFSYQPNVDSFAGIQSQVNVTMSGEADVVINVGGLNVGTERYVSGKYYTQEYYDSFDNLIKSESQFVPFGPSQDQDDNGFDGNGSGVGPGPGGGVPLYPNSISNQQMYLNTTDGSLNCLNSYSSSCFEDTYVEGIEFNPDLKSIPIIDNLNINFIQANYTAPQTVSEVETNINLIIGGGNGSGGGGGSGSIVTKSPKLSPEIAAWKFDKIVSSLDNYQQAEHLAAQKNKEYQVRRDANYQKYQQQIVQLSESNAQIKQEYNNVLSSLSELLKDYKPQPFVDIAKSANSLPTQFEYHTLNGKAREVLESKLLNALQSKNIRQYVRTAEQLMNSNDYHLSRSKIVVNESGVLQSNVLNSAIERSPLDTLDLKNIRSAHNRELVRHVANKYQTQWVEFDGLSSMNGEQALLYSMGLGFIQEAVTSGLENASKSLLVYLDAAIAVHEAVGKFGVGLGTGLGQKVVDKLMEIPDLALLIYENYDKLPTTQEELVEVARLIQRAAPHFKTALVDGAKKYKDDLLYGDALTKGAATGYIIGEAVDLLFPVGKATSVTKVAKIIGKVDDVTTLTKTAKVITPELGVMLDGLESSKKMYAASIIIESTKSEVDYIKNNATRIVTDVIKSNDEDVLFTVDRLVTSSRTFDATKIGNGYGMIQPNVILKNETDLSKFVDDISFISKKMDSVDGITVSGVVSRYTESRHLVGTTPMDAHLGNLVIGGRYAIGGVDGIDVMSYGFGSNLSSSKIVSGFESSVFSHNEHLYTFAHSEKSFDKILDLTNDKNLATLGLKKHNIVDLDYLLTQSIGALAKKKEFNGILAPSAKAGGSVLHIFGDQSL